MCFLEEFNGFINNILSNYSKVECSPMVVLWLCEAQLDQCFMYLIFGRKHVYLSSDNLTVIIGWIVEQRDMFDNNGTDCLECQ